MLHAAAMLAGLSTIWLLLTQAWATPVDIAWAVGAALLCLFVSARFGGLGKTGPFLRAPQTLLVLLTRSGAVMRGALATVRAAIAADVTVKPALVRVKWRSPTVDERAAFAGLVSASPGAVAVETEPDGVLVHVINEDAVDAEDFSRIEAQVSGGRRAL
jgi:multisubunit Na+/H+ antiporter MnhE subunit